MRISEIDVPPRPQPGQVLLQCGLAKEAFPFLLKDHDPADYRSWSNLAACHRIMGNIFAAKECAKKALELEHTAYKAWFELSMAMEDFGEFEKARDAVNVAYELRPMDRDIAYRWATLNMRLAPWKDYLQVFEESREGAMRFPFKIPRAPRVAKTISDLAGMNVLVLHEGGYGDFIWRMRYLRLLKDVGCHVTYISWDRQRDFAKRNCPWADVVLASGDELNEADYDVQMPISSLLTLHGGPLYASEPFIFPDPINFPKHGFTVGVCWITDENGVDRKWRQIPEPVMSCLSDLPATFVPLHLSNTNPDWCFDSRSLMRQGWNTTASVIRECDLVITADTAAGHLAGAIGVETWILLPCNSVWEWGPVKDVQPTPWYSSVTLMRNPEPMEWTRLLSYVHDTLAKKLEVACATV